MAPGAGEGVEQFVDPIRGDEGEYRADGTARRLGVPAVDRGLVCLAPPPETGDLWATR